MSIFAGSALLIAVAGVYGVVAYSVIQRKREMAIRMALGAKRSDVLMLVLKNAAFLLTLGLGAGIFASLLAAHAIESLLFGVGGHDAMTLVSVCLLLAGCGVTAAFVPARRAASIEPMEALRID
jgi:ABC-type antimicrobial peptide transport system permease subunit